MDKMAVMAGMMLTASAMSMMTMLMVLW